MNPVQRYSADPYLSWQSFFEVIYSPFKSTIDFCLVNNFPISFISTLELRQLDSGMYATVVGPTSGQYLFMIARENYGFRNTTPWTDYRRYIWVQFKVEKCFKPTFSCLAPSHFRIFNFPYEFVVPK